jgi:DNA repair protein RecO (recombination protein O)
MLVGALRTLSDTNLDATLLAPAFFLKALVLEGAGPVLDACASCAEPEGEVELVAFDLSEGGALCRNCRRGRPLSPDALALLRRILGGGLASLLKGPPASGADEVVVLATEAMETHLDRRLRSVRAAPSI